MNVKQAEILDKTVPKIGNYLFEKTEVTEAAPRPTPITYSLLLKLYNQNGPIQKVYEKYNIKYIPNNFFVLIGDDLYIDKEKELQTLLPSYSYFGQENFIPHVARLKGSLIAVNNLFFLNRITVDDDRLRKLATDTLQNPFPATLSFPETVERFLNEYKLVFEINILISKKVKELENFLKKYEIKILISNFLTLEKKEFSKEIMLYIKEKTKQWAGNSLELSDVSPFYPVSFVDSEKGREEVQVIKQLPKERQFKLQQLFLEIRKLLALRYIGSLITFKNINKIREKILDFAVRNKYMQKDHIYFSTLDELLKGEFSEEIGRKRKKEYDQLLPLHFPKILSNKIQTETIQSKGVSKGKTSGILVTKENVEKVEGDIILYTPVLSPDLVMYFGKIKGIVAEQGSILSHAAIVAREMHIPVVIHGGSENLRVKIGDTVEIDGEKGTILTISD